MPDQPTHDPSTNCYCGGPEEIYPHQRGTGLYCRHQAAASGSAPTRAQDPSPIVFDVPQPPPGVTRVWFVDRHDDNRQRWAELDVNGLNPTMWRTDQGNIVTWGGLLVSYGRLTDATSPGAAFDAPLDARRDTVAPIEEDVRHSDHRVLIDVLEIAPDGTTHTYWSTHCRHAALLDGAEAKRLHGMCSATEMSGRNVLAREGWRATIARNPAQCKHCQSPCICPCHKSSSEGEAAA